MSLVNREMSGQASRQSQQLHQIKAELDNRHSHGSDVASLQKQVEELLEQVEKQTLEAELKNEMYASLKDRYEKLVQERSAQGPEATEAAGPHVEEGVSSQVDDGGHMTSGDAGRELQQAKSVIMELESRVMVRDSSIAQLEKEMAMTRTTMTALEESKLTAEKVIEELKTKMGTFVEDSAKLEKLEASRADAEARIAELQNQLGYLNNMVCAQSRK